MGRLAAAIPPTSGFSPNDRIFPLFLPIVTVAGAFTFAFHYLRPAFFGEKSSLRVLDTIRRDAVRSEHQRLCL